MKLFKRICCLVLCGALAAMIAGGGIFYARKRTAYMETKIKPLATQRLSVFNEIADKESFRICVRRGFAAKAPENTLEAIRLAGEAGFRFVQLDVAQTKDGVAVLLFDNAVDRMTAESGRIRSFTAEQISDLALDNGANIEKYEKVRIPQLQSALRECADYGMTAYLSVHSLRMPEKFLEEIQKSPVPVMLFSTQKSTLQALQNSGRQLCFQVGAVTREGLRFAVENGYALAFDAELSENTDEALRTAGQSVPLYACGVNDRQALRRMEKLNIRDVLTDRLIPVSSEKISR